MLVFNNEVFKQHSSRPGSSVDVMNIIKTFSKLGFDVQCHGNQTKSQMMSTLKKGKFTQQIPFPCNEYTYEGLSRSLWTNVKKLTIIVGFV